MKICILFGTRPEIIKMSPLIRECERLGNQYFILHTGQHFTYDMDKVFFRDLQLPDPHYYLDTVAKTQSRTPAHLLGLMMVGIEEVLTKERPDVVLVPSDPHATLAGAIVAAHMHMKVGHVESGLRSYDWTMPEEINRIMTDHISTYLFAPTEECAKILRSEGLSPAKIHITGNTVVDAVLKHVQIAKDKSAILYSLKVKEKNYLLLTLHRAENLNDPIRMKGIFQGIEAVAKWVKKEVIFPIHPSTEKALKKYQLNIPVGVKTISPLGYLDFLTLEASADLILTDSGGIQEETAILQVPCVTLRDNTERPESVKSGSNMVAGWKGEKILSCVQEMLSRKRDWHNPFGDGKAAERIIKIVTPS